MLNSSAQKLLDTAEEGTHMTNWSGAFTSNQSGNVKYQKIGDKVTLFIPEVQATSSNHADIQMVTMLPASLTPSAEEKCTIMVLVDMGSAQQGLATIGIGGTIKIDSDLYGGKFYGTGTEGLYKSTITYNLN